MEVFMNKNVLSLLATSMSVLLLSDCSASCLEDLDPAERNTPTKVASPRSEAVSSTSQQVPAENEEPTVNPVVAFFEGMPQEKHRKFLIKVGLLPTPYGTNFYDWSGFKSDDPAKVEEATARWEKAKQTIQNGKTKMSNWDAARGIADYLWESGKLEECRVHIESLCARTSDDSARNFGLFAKVLGYSNGDYGFEKEKDPSKARAILEQGKSENNQYLSNLYWEGVMNGQYGFPKPEDLSTFHEDLFSLADAGDKNLRKKILEGYWCGWNSFPKDFDEGKRLNDLYIEEELKEPFDWNLSDSSAIIRKLKGLNLSHKNGDLYCYKGDVHALEQFLEKLKMEGSIEVKVFANFLHTALKDDIEIKKQEESRRQEALRREEERKRQQDLRRQEAEKRSKETKVARSGVSVGIVSSFATPFATSFTNNGPFNFSGK